jgi:hypothetical protein
MKCRNTTLYRVFYRLNGERRPKSFSSLADAKADAKKIIKEIYTQGERKFHLATDEKLDWQAAWPSDRKNCGGSNGGDGAAWIDSVGRTQEEMASHFSVL